MCVISTPHFAVLRSNHIPSLEGCAGETRKQRRPFTPVAPAIPSCLQLNWQHAQSSGLAPSQYKIAGPPPVPCICDMQVPDDPISDSRGWSTVMMPARRSIFLCSLLFPPYPVSFLSRPPTMLSPVRCVCVWVIVAIRIAAGCTCVGTIGGTDYQRSSLAQAQQPSPRKSKDDMSRACIIPAHYLQSTCNDFQLGVVIASL